MLQHAIVRARQRLRDHEQARGWSMSASPVLEVKELVLAMVHVAVTLVQTLK